MNKRKMSPRERQMIAAMEELLADVTGECVLPSEGVEPDYAVDWVKEQFDV